MSSNDRIILLTGGDNFEITGEKVDEIPFRNVISITNSVELGSDKITPSTFTLKSTTNYQDLYVDFTESGLRFKIPSKNMLIRVDQRNLNTSINVISDLRMSWNFVDFDGSWSKANLSLLSSDFIAYKNTSGIITCLQCIPEYYYINSVSGIYININAIPIPAGDLTLEFFQF